MSAIETLAKLLETDIFYDAGLKYCLVTNDKRPVKVDGTMAKPNAVNDFVDIETICQCEDLGSYAGIGVSIQASNICAIDIDDCFSEKFDLSSADERAKDAIEMFKDIAYIEFSFSGLGLRILFRHPVIKDYSSKYYIKNDKNSIEYYQPSQSYRYVTVTGMTIAANKIVSEHDVRHVLFGFLDKYMLRPQLNKQTVLTSEVETKSYEDLMKVVKRLYLKDFRFQDLWFGVAPGSGKNESQLDYHLLSDLFEKVTRDKELLRQIFEASPYFKSKDWHHIDKWEKSEHRYYNYVYSQIASKYL